MIFFKKRRMNKIFPIDWINKKTLLYEFNEIEEFNHLKPTKKVSLILSISNKQINSLINTISDAISNNSHVNPHDITEDNIHDFLRSIFKKHLLT